MVVWFGLNRAALGKTVKLSSFLTCSLSWFLKDIFVSQKHELRTRKDMLNSTSPTTAGKVFHCSEQPTFGWEEVNITATLKSYS